MDALGWISFAAAAVLLGLWLSERNARIALERDANRALGDSDWRSRQREEGLKRDWAKAADRGNDELRTAYSRLERTEKEIQALVKDKQRLGQDLERERQYAEEKIGGVAVGRQKIADRYLDDTKKWLVAKISPNNLETTRTKFEKAVTFVNKNGARTTGALLSETDAEIVAAFKDAVRKEEVRNEQARIREQIREEQRVERELAKAKEQADREEQHIQDALAKALAKADAEHSAEVAQLREQMAALEEKRKKLSMAQQTKAGHVYVISNIGSFGDGVFKVGMTRRLEPQERVDELGDASVPFPFDVHMMISCDNAPRLENALHKELHERRLNKVNLRKEFFRASLDEIVAIVKREHGHVDYKADAAAEAYFESKAMEERKAHPQFLQSVDTVSLDDAE